MGHSSSKDKIRLLMVNDIYCRLFILESAQKVIKEISKI